MRKTVIPAGTFLLLLFIFSCQKPDLKNSEPVDPTVEETLAAKQGGNSQCNFIYATSAWLSGNQNPDYRLFTKEYKFGKLSRITASIQNVVGGGLDSVPFKVQYGFRRMDFVDEGSGQTAATFRFDHQGKPVTASLGDFSLPFSYEYPRITYRFYYSRGRLSEIKYQWNPDPVLCQEHPEVCADPPPLETYLKIQYDHHGNISAMYGGDDTRFKYEYDAKKKVKDQFYADEAIYDWFDFWFFLRYLDLLPELRPEYLLLRSVFTGPEDGYLTGFERRYHNQKFDRGRLVSYDVQTRSSWATGRRSNRGGRLDADESWKVFWDCR